jgi:hydrogenase expression/formation protein HypC
MCLGTLGEIESIWSEGGVPMARTPGGEVCLLYVPEASVGDTVLVHMGFALEILDDDRARAARDLRSELFGL